VSAVPVLLVGEDLALPGIERADLVDGLEVVSRTRIRALATARDQVWHW